MLDSMMGSDPVGRCLLMICESVPILRARPLFFSGSWRNSSPIESVYFRDFLILLLAFLSIFWIWVGRRGMSGQAVAIV